MNSYKNIGMKVAREKMCWQAPMMLDNILPNSYNNDDIYENMVRSLIPTKSYRILSVIEEPKKENKLSNDKA